MDCEKRKRSEPGELIFQKKARQLSLALVLLIRGYSFVISSVAIGQIYRFSASRHHFSRVMTVVACVVKWLPLCRPMPFLCLTRYSTLFRHVVLIDKNTAGGGPAVRLGSARSG